MMQQSEFNDPKPGEKDTVSEQETGRSIASQILNEQSNDLSLNTRSNRAFEPNFSGRGNNRPYLTSDEILNGRYFLSTPYFGGNIEEKFFDKWDTDQSGDLSKEELKSARDKSIEGSTENQAAEVLLDNYKEATDMATAMNPILLSRLTGDFVGAPVYEKNFGNDWKFGISRKDFQAMSKAAHSRGSGSIYDISSDLPVVLGSVGVALAFTGAAALCNVVPQWNALRFPLLGMAFLAQVPAMRISLRTSNSLYGEQINSRTEKMDRWFQNHANKLGS